jgi:hypothetical protein
LPPVIDTPTEGALVTDAPSFTGTGEPGARVTVSEGGVPLCSATVSGAGTWTCTPAGPIGPGPHGVTATQVDLAGNLSDPSEERTFLVSSGLEIVLSDAVVRIGDTVTATGMGFQPGEEVSGVLASTPVDLGLQIADPSGTVVFTTTIPADFELGTHTFTLTGALSGSVSAQITVIGSGGVAFTGATVDGPLALGVLSIVLGAILLIGALGKRGWSLTSSRRRHAG